MTPHRHLLLLFATALSLTLATLCLFSPSPHLLQTILLLLSPGLLLSLLHRLLLRQDKPSPRPLALGTTISLAIATATLRLLLVPQLFTLPPAIPSPTTLHHVRARVVSQPDPTAHGWSVQLEDTTTRRRYLATLPDSTPPLPGDTLLIDAFTLRPTPARSAPHIPHPLERLRDARLHGHARVHTITSSSPPHDPDLLQLASRALSAGRLRLILSIREHHQPDQASILLAMLLGSKRLLPDHVREPLAVTGTAHLLAISGLHLSTLAILLVLLLRPLLILFAPRATLRFGISRLTHPITATLLALYVLLIGAPPSALRALAMTLLLLLAHASNRRPAPHLILSGALALLCLLDPLLTRHPALWLSAAATHAILLAVLPASVSSTAPDDASSPLARKLRQLARISTFAFLGTAPVILHLQRELPVLLAIPLNMLLVPLVSVFLFPIMVLGAANLPFCPRLAHLLLDLSATLMLHLSQACDQLAAMTSPHTLFRPTELLSSHLPALLITTTLSLLILSRARLSHRRAHALLAVALIALPPVIDRLHHARHPTHTALRIDFIPVGQGDATLITFPDGATMLVDAGGSPLGRDPGAHQVMPWLRARGVGRLDWLLLTHPDADHMLGMFAIVRHAPPHTFITTSDHDDPHYSRLLEALDTRGATIHELGHGATPTSPSILHESFVHAGVTVDLWAIAPSLAPAKNDRSIVLALHHEGHTILLTGDIEASAEALLTPHLPRHVTLLKAPHHGSKTSSTTELLTHTAPLHALISCGLANRFSHPHPEVVSRYQGLGAAVHRTDRHGLITATIDHHQTFSISHTPQLP